MDKPQIVTLGGDAIGIGPSMFPGGKFWLVIGGKPGRCEFFDRANATLLRDALTAALEGEEG